MKTVVIFSKRDIKNPMRGGGDTYVHEIAKGLAQKYKVIILTIGYQGASPIEVIDGVEVHRIGFNITLGRFLLPLYFKRHFAKADLVIDSVTVIPWFSPLFASHRNLMIFYQLVGDIFYQELPPIVAHLAFLVEPPLYKIYKNTPIVTISPSSRDALASLGLSDSHLVHIVPPGIPSSLIQQDKQRGIEREPIIICLSRVVAYKGIQYAVMALPRIFKEVPEAKLIVIGKGPYLPKLIQLTNKLGLAQYVTFAGYLSEAEKIEMLKRARVLVFPSKREGWGINILEANAMKVPAVGWNSPGIKDTVRDDDTGFLVPLGNIDLLADRVATLLTDNTCWNRISHNAFTWAKEHTWENTRSNFTNVVENLIGR
ncbi:MAG: glycosyltransferase family 4 protein [Desulfobacterales bacterium]|nr:glycosyltransferase family 4 protein [Desulfobacterales bacterium]